jgi:hypothetical protein
MDVVAASATDLVRALAGDAAPERSPLVPLADAALQRLADDATLSRGDRQTALVSRIELARLGLPKDAVAPKLPEPLLKDVREAAARNDREITDPYERQAVVTGDAYALGLAGLWGESDALLKSNLAKSHSPYYLMSQLGSNARKLGRSDEALRWYAQAFEKSEGPATRLQWGAGYLSALVDLAPRDGARIEKTASRLFAEATQDSGAFDGRSARSLQRVGRKLAAWGAEGNAAALKRLQAQLDGLCAKVETGPARRLPAPAAAGAEGGLAPPVRARSSPARAPARRCAARARSASRAASRSSARCRRGRRRRACARRGAQRGGRAARACAGRGPGAASRRRRRRRTRRCRRRS